MKKGASNESRARAARLASLDEIEVEIEKLVAGGDGLARYEGVPLFVPRSAPGDRVRVRIVERRPDFGRAEILEVLSPGAGRREPPCPHFAACGGCDLQHLEDELQTDLKSRSAEETLRRLGGISLSGVATRTVRGEAWGYRLRTQLHVAGSGSERRVGYFARATHDIVVPTACPILEPHLERAVLDLAADRERELPRRVDLAVGADGALTTAPVVSDLPHGEVSLRLEELELGYDARCFFQSHGGLLPQLVRAVVDSHSGEEAYDLYAGVGLFSLFLARTCRRVVAVEGNRVAARHAKRNARRNRMSNVEVVSKAVESWIDELPEGASRVVVDPPRSGLSAIVRRALVRRRPERLTYVSCHPATLARDLAELGEVYRLESVTYFDLFPQTGHLETVAQLVVAERPAPKDAGAGGRGER